MDNLLLLFFSKDESRRRLHFVHQFGRKLEHRSSMRSRSKQMCSVGKESQGKLCCFSRSCISGTIRWFGFDSNKLSVNTCIH